MKTYRDLPDGALYIWAAHKRAAYPEVLRRVSVHQSQDLTGKRFAMAAADHEVIEVRAKVKSCDDDVDGETVRTWDVTIAGIVLHQQIATRSEARAIAKKINAGQE